MIPKLNQSTKVVQFFGGGSSTTVQSYTPTAEEKRLWTLEGDYQEKAMPYMIDLLQTSRQLKNANNYGTIGADFGALNENALNQISTAQTGIANLANGQLPQSYLNNMQSVLNNSVKTAMGSSLNSLAANGVLNSSITNTTMNDISKNATNTMAENYLNNISTLNGLYGQLDSMAGDQITSTAAAQEAALSPMLSILSASQGGSANNTSAIGALKGTGTTTSTTSTSGSGLFNSLLGAGTSFLGSYYNGYAACFTGDTVVAVPGGAHVVIRDINVGDEVVAYSNGDGEYVAKVLEKTETHNVRTVLIDLEIQHNDNTYLEYIITTPEQAFMDVNGEFVKVKDITEGDKLLGNNGDTIKVIGVENAGHATVYDLKVDGDNTYAAGSLIANGIVKEGEE